MLASSAASLATALTMTSCTKFAYSKQATATARRIRRRKNSDNASSPGRRQALKNWLSMGKVNATNDKKRRHSEPHPLSSPLQRLGQPKPWIQPTGPPVLLAQSSSSMGLAWFIRRHSLNFLLINKLNVDLEPIPSAHSTAQHRGNSPRGYTHTHTLNAKWNKSWKRINKEKAHWFISASLLLTF